MSEVMLNVVDAQGAVHGRIHGAVGDRVVAALNAEPETIAELQAATRRFMHTNRGLFEGWQPGACQQPWDAGICCIDLAARLVVSRSRYSVASARGSVAYHDGQAANDVQLPYQVSDEWMFSRDVDHWPSLAQRRRTRRSARPPREHRTVLYGQVARFLVHECLAAGKSLARSVAMRDRGSGRALDGNDDDVAAEIISEIHARWLTTPSDELLGRTPRDVLLAQRGFIDLDLQHREHHWSTLGWCPPGLDPDTAAFRFAGFGTHEIVLYYELLRHLLWSCWHRVVEQPDLDPCAEVHWLQQAQQEWLHSPQDGDLCDRCPAYIIDRERARLPLALSDEEGSFAHDARQRRPISDESRPVFWHLDACNMEDEFAFSFHLTREQWEHQQREWQAMYRHEIP